MLAETELDPRPTAALRRAATAAGERSRQAALVACRELMVGGRFRPSLLDLKAKDVSRKIVQRHFETIGALHEEALDDETRVRILRFLVPNGPWPAADDCSRIVRAVVLGRATQ